MKMAKLGEVAEFVNGFPFKPEDWHDDGLPIVRIQNLTDAAKPINRTTRSVPDRFQVRRGELLVSWSATLGVFTWERSDRALVNQHIFRVIPKPGVVRTDYLRHVLVDALGSIKKHLHGATMKHVNRREFLDTLVAVPPNNEQRRIAAILDQAGGLRAKRRQILAHLDLLAQSIFREMFGDGYIYERVTLGDVVSRIDNGSSPLCESRPASPIEWGVLKLGAVTYGVFRPEDNKAFLGDTESMTGNEVQRGDVLMTRKNTRDLVGAVALVDDVRPRLLLPDLIFRLHLDSDRVDRRYFHALMMSPGKREAVRNLSSGSAASMPNISKSRLRQLPIELPPRPVQREFASRMKAVDVHRVAMSRAIAADDELVASLQSRAFRGEL